MFYDTHFHILHLEKKLEIPAEQILENIFTGNISFAADIAVDENNFSRRIKLTEMFPKLILSAGIHPSSCSSAINESRWQLIQKQAENRSVRAIGETGLDFFRETVPEKIQIEAFKKHLELASQLDLPVIIHNREADSKIFQVIKSTSCRNGIFHCFSSDWETAGKALDLGFYISFAGNLTYKKNDFIREAAAKVPSERLLIETDSPYLSPQKVRNKINTPLHIEYTAEVLSQIRNVPIEELAHITLENAKRIYRI